ncbi:Uncharacterized MFS-type transporter YdeR [uncultured Alphaproteobacteria bacterium]|uniref:Uncharacterized MFS-type transporter YdeR n=1 Tax=uncultured Alphaproteobacteria bacterium TaxID=91750 RepID=A0A212JF00_9PROT|nr:Uncharacterized MFS-type transporter YdeR [uncultured Alphaproteobacteria bacterium]
MSKSPSAWVVLLLAFACGAIVANLYYAQPLVGPIAADLGLPRASAGVIVTVSQIGYGLGLLLLVPLADLVENRRLIVATVAASALALAAAAVAGEGAVFLCAALAIGVGSVAAQMLVPFAAHLAPEAVRGRVVGNVMSGLMLGIMLARPFASFIAEFASWHWVFAISAAAMAALALLLRAGLPQRRPGARLSYASLLASMAYLVAGTPALRRRGGYQACLFGAFSLFWTAAPLHLASPAYGLSQGGIALFALAGVAGAVAAPIAGRIADTGRIRALSAAAMAVSAAAFGLALAAGEGSALGLGLLTAAAIVLDFGVSANLVAGQRVIFGLKPELRSRLNGLYIAMFFVGGAVGSALGGWVYAQSGWRETALVGLALPLAALAVLATERK